MNLGSSRILKHRRTTELDIEEPKVGLVEVGAMLTRAGRLVDRSVG